MEDDNRDDQPAKAGSDHACGIARFSDRLE